MDKKLAGLLGAAAVFTAANAAQATPSQPLQTAANYRELLEPVPNAVELLKADDARLVSQSTQGTVKLAQYHHHHHHHGYARPRFFVRPYRRYHHHHHHHHHQGFSIRIR